MKTISEQDFWAFCHQATVLVQYKALPKVLVTPEGQIIKVFVRRRTFSKNSLWPQVRRFANNAQRLASRGIPSIEPPVLYHCPELRIHLAIYPKIEGQEIRQIIREGNIAILNEIAAFIATLHHQGIFFRGLHLGNLLKGETAIYLIDIADLKVKARPLGLYQRLRNLRHLLENRDDYPTFKVFGIARFIKLYAEAASLSSLQVRLLFLYLNKFVNDSQ